MTDNLPQQLREAFQLIANGSFVSASTAMKLFADSATQMEQMKKALHYAYRHIDECCPHRLPDEYRFDLGEKL